MRVERVIRLLGLVLGLIAGIYYASFIIRQTPIVGQPTQAIVLLLVMLAGGLFGYFGLPYVTTRPFFWLEEKLNVTPLPDLVGAIVGLLTGLLLAVLVGVLLQNLPYRLGLAISLVLALLLARWGVQVGISRRQELVALVRGTRGGGPAGRDGEPRTVAQILLDTSVVIDGRITDIAKTGFLEGRLLVPHFVLAELQYIADSSDPLRRARGRRGLETLNLLQKDTQVDIQFTDDDLPDVPEVDTKLIRLAKQYGASIMTNDYNLNRVAQLGGIKILNINDLANAVKPVAIPGEEMTVEIIKEGKEPNQGVAYLDDGTMIVVENGRKNIGQTIPVVVTSVLQTAAGRMIFAMPHTGAPGEELPFKSRPSRRFPRIGGGR
jgi:uncharacterized protein YacL